MLNNGMVNITVLGANGDGITDNSTVIQKAIDQASQDGSIVFFPKGTFVTGTLFLRSNTTLHLSAGTVLNVHTGSIW